MIRVFSYVVGVVVVVVGYFMQSDEMRNIDFLKILNNGVKYWNSWREENPDVIPVLSNMTLSLTRPAFSHKDAEYLTRNLEGINFENTDFSWSILRGINLRKSNLRNCNFYSSDLRRSNLTQSDLRFAKFNLSNLTLANLNQAKIDNALFWETFLSRTSFFDTIGLEKCKHGGPSLIDIGTIKKSNGLPINFLRGIGVPDPIINVYSSMNNNFNSCFISYSHKDEEFVLKLWKDLQNKGVRCWYAPDDLEFGDKFREKIEEAIQIHNKLIIVLSKKSMNSGWVEDEIEIIMEREYSEKNPLFIPIRIDETIWNSKIAWTKKIKRTRHIGDFTNWKNENNYEVVFQKLLRALRKK